MGHFLILRYGFSEPGGCNGSSCDDGFPMLDAERDASMQSGSLLGELVGSIVSFALHGGDSAVVNVSLSGVRKDLNDLIFAWFECKEQVPHFVPRGSILAGGAEAPNLSFFDPVDDEGRVRKNAKWWQDAFDGLEQSEEFRVVTILEAPREHAI